MADVGYYGYNFTVLIHPDMGDWSPNRTLHIMEWQTGKHDRKCNAGYMSDSFIRLRICHWYCNQFCGLLLGGGTLANVDHKFYHDFYQGFRD